MKNNAVIIYIVVFLIGFFARDIFAPFSFFQSNQQAGATTNEPLQQPIKVKTPSTEQKNKPLNFYDVKSDANYTVVLFYTNWCPACKKFKPYWNEMKKYYSDKFEFKEFDAEDSKNYTIVSKFNVKSIPQVYIYDKRTKVNHKLNLNQFENELRKYARE